MHLNFAEWGALQFLSKKDKKLGWSIWAAGFPRWFLNSYFRVFWAKE